MDAAALVGVSTRKKTPVLKRYTVPGALTSAVASYAYKEALGQRRVVDTARTSFERDYQNALTNPYHVQQATGVYNVGIIEGKTAGLAGMDLVNDDDSGGGGWSDVVKVFVGEIGKGIGGRISGDNPYITTQAPPAAKASEVPGWVKWAVIGGSVLIGGGLVLSFARRR